MGHDIGAEHASKRMGDPNMSDKTNLLIIEDDRNLVDAMQLYLASADFEISVAYDGLEGLQMVYSQRPDLVILDLMLPKLDGWEVCERVRGVSDVPIIMLTARGQEAERVKGLKMGADDYMVKPFSLKELEARVQAVLRRAAWGPPDGSEASYSDDYLTVDLANRRVSLQGEAVELTPTEFRLLAYLVENGNRVLTYGQLLENVWGWEYMDDFDYIRVYVWRLRKKIEQDAKNPRYIRTEHGVGYRFQMAE